MNDILSGLPGVLCHVDDILVFGATPSEHDDRLWAVLERIKDAGVTINAEKFQFSQTRIMFLGHVIDHHGISPDPRKTTVISAMKPPSSVTELGFAQIEKEALALTWVLEKFSEYIHPWQSHPVGN